MWGTVAKDCITYVGNMSACVCVCCCYRGAHLPYAPSGLLCRLTDRSESHLTSHDSFQEAKKGKNECVCARCTI